MLNICFYLNTLYFDQLFKAIHYVKVLVFFVESNVTYVRVQKVRMYKFFSWMGTNSRYKIL